jgi:hypothetical protein
VTSSRQSGWPHSQKNSQSADAAEDSCAASRMCELTSARAAVLKVLLSSSDQWCGMPSIAGYDAGCLKQGVALDRSWGPAARGLIRSAGLMSQGSLGGFGERCELFAGWWLEEFAQGAGFPALEGDRRVGSQGPVEDEGEVAG